MTIVHVCTLLSLQSAARVYNNRDSPFTSSRSATQLAVTSKGVANIHIAHASFVRASCASACTAGNNECVCKQSRERVGVAVS